MAREIFLLMFPIGDFVGGRFVNNINKSGEQILWIVEHR